MAFPVSQPNDGLIDLTVHLLVSSSQISTLAIAEHRHQSSRREILKCLGGAHKGETFWINNVSFLALGLYDFPYLLNFIAEVLQGTRVSGETFHYEGCLVCGWRTF
jgi:hypothetical protein